MAVNEDREFDIIIFGATGYTGQYVIEELAHTSVSTNTKWAVAGRNKDKLSQSIEIVQGYLGEGINIGNIPIIEADVKDVSSLSSMCKRCKLVINCVGPYKLFGEPVIQACIENGTHHVDLSGEMKYLEETQMKYFNAAREKRIYIVGACGFDSIPADYGLTVLKENFPGDLNSIEFYAFVGVGPSGKVMNIGTFLSAIYSFWDHMFVKRADRALKESLFPKDLPQTDYSLPWRKPPLFHSSDERAWALWFLGPDERVILRSQLFRYNFLNERPILNHGYLKLKSFCSGLGLMFAAMYLAIMTICGCGRSLLAKYPSFFTAGKFSNAGPTRQQVMEGTTRVTFYGQGWKDKPSDPNERRTTKPDLKMKLIIEGSEPAYALTSTCIVQAGLTILEDHDRMPLEGGVLTPGVAFANTSLRQRLEKRGVTFTFENTNETLTV
nr:saccharopine dehydrogenase-like oxidoreductase isoform X1 [Parasteatoda tepidariorum]